MKEEKNSVENTQNTGMIVFIDSTNVEWSNVLVAESTKSINHDHYSEFVILSGQLGSHPKKSYMIISVVYE